MFRLVVYGTVMLVVLVGRVLFVSFDADFRCFDYLWFADFSWIGLLCLGICIVFCYDLILSLGLVVIGLGVVML